jgi:glycine cleavage system transcriptional repressor
VNGARRHYFLTAIGPDRPGLVATVARALARAGGNIEDAAMSRFHDWFAMMLLVSVSADASLSAELPDLGTLPDLRVDLRPVTAQASPSGAMTPTHRISVYGPDKPGIVAQVAEALASRGANILDLEVDVVPQDGGALFVMVVDVATTAEALKDLTTVLRQALQMEVHTVALEGIVL